MTSGGKRLDILAQSSDLVIGVENKLFASVYNDLKDYSDFLDKKAEPTGKPPVKIILCLEKEKLNQDHGFKMISYEEFSERLLSNIGSEILDANPRYLGLLLDFVNTMKNRKTGTHMDAELVKFFKDNRPKTVELYRQAENLRSELKQKTTELKQDMKLPPGIRGPMSYDKIEEGYDYFYSTVYSEVDIPDGIRLVLEVTLRRKEGEEKDGWQIYAFARKASQQQVSDWLKKKKIPSLKADSSQWTYAEFPFNESVETVRAKYEELLNLVYKAL